MPDPDSGDRLFDETEIGRILQRTAELQGQRPPAPAAGLTLDELKALAAESGLDPNLVVTAVTELQIGRTDRGGSWWGGPTTHTMDVVLPGPVSDHAWERMLDAVRQVMGQIGRVEVRGTTREWIMDKKDEGNGRFSVRQEADGTSHVHLHWSAPLAAILSYIFQGILSLIALPILFEELSLGVFPGIPAYLAIVGTLFFLARWLVSRAGERNEARVVELARIVSAVGAADARSAIEPPLAESAGATVQSRDARPMLDDLEDDSPDGHDTRTRPRERS